MKNEVRQLLTFVVRNGAIVAENCLIANPEDRADIVNDMRNKMNTVEDKLENNQELDVEDWIMLYTAALTSKEVIAKNAHTYAAVVKEYEDNLIPKLHKIATATSDEQRQEFIEDYFD